MRWWRLWPSIQSLLLCITLCRGRSTRGLSTVGRRRQPPQRELWNHKAKGGLASSPVLSPDSSVLYVGSNGKEFIALRTSDGKQLWSVPAGRWVYCSPTLTKAGDVVYYGSDDHYMRAVNTTDGAIIWSFEAGGEMTSKPALSPNEDVLYAGCHDKLLRAFQTSSGTVIWAFQAEDQVTSSPVVSPDGSTIYVGSYDKHLYALRADTGAVRWKFTTGAEIWSSPVLSPDGTRVYVGSNDKSCYSVNAATGAMVWNFTTRGLIEGAPHLSPSGDVVYIGSDDFHMYAVKAKDGKQLWRFAAGDAVSCSPTVTADGGMVYVGANNGNLFAIEAASGREQWRFATEGPIFATPAVSTAKGQDVVYAASWDGHVYAVRTGTLTAGFEVDPAAIGLVVSGVVLVLWAGLWYYLKWKHFGLLMDTPRHQETEDEGGMPTSTSHRWSRRSSTRLVGRSVTRTLPFWVAGATIGLAFGAATMWVQVLIRSKMPYGQGTNYPKDFFGSVPFYSLAVFLSMLLMAFVWGLWALLAIVRHERILHRLPDFCCFVVLYSSLTIAFNLVPGCWVTIYETNTTTAGRIGSKPAVLFWWLCLSYPVGLGTLACELWFLEGIFLGLEQQAITSSTPTGASERRRIWRGHWSRRWITVVTAFNWGFMTYWLWTGATMYMFNYHRGYVPPFTPLSVLGWAVGTLSLSLRLSRRPTPTSNHRAWIRKRVADVIGLLSCWPSRANRQLKRRWKRLSRDVVRHVDPKTLLRLLLNASCPDIWGLRRRVSAYTGIHLSSLPGCQATINDELDWAFARFAVSSLTAVLPLIGYWMYQRFGDGRVLGINPPYTTLKDTPWVTLPNTFNQDPQQNMTPPLPLLPTPNLGYNPLQYEGGPGASPFQPCSWDDTEVAVDPGDFNMCLTAQYQQCMQEDNCVFPKCLGLATNILAEPSHSLWFQTQLLCYVGFLLFVLWTIKLERDEKLYVSIAFRLNGIFRDSHDRYRASTQICARLVLMVLGGLYGVSLMLDNVEEHFVFFATYFIKRNSFYITSKGTITSPPPLLVWFCEAMGNEVYTARVTYSLKMSALPIVAIVQGIYFFYQLYGMLEAQTQVYDFVAPDVLLTSQLETEHPEQECSYWAILQQRDSGKVIERSDVDEYLHKTVYMPFLLEMHLTRPDLLHTLFNQHEAQLLLEAIEDFASSGGMEELGAQEEENGRYGGGGEVELRQRL